MKMSKLVVSVVAAGLVSMAALTPAVAQMRNPVDRLGQMFGRSPPPDADDDVPPMARPDPGASVRVDRLENQVRSMTGQIEQLQFSLRQMQDQLRKFQQDTDFRLQESANGRPMRRSEEGVPPIVAQTTPPPVVTPSTTPIDPTRLRRGDAFDPTSQPSAPGAPRQIGTLPGSALPQVPATGATRLPSGPMASDAGVPMDLSGGRLASNGGVVESSRSGAIVGAPLPAGGPLINPPPGALPAPGVVTTPGGTILASREPFSPKDEFDAATGYMKGGQYEAAEKGYATFLQKNPKNRLVPEAVFDLGETYFLRGRHREAAEQYLKISTTYSSSSRAPEAMLRLGQSLVAMGAKEQACASFGEVGRKYPSASANVKASADREAKKNAC